MAEETELHVLEWGRGRRVALLVHGQLASAEAWWEVAPRIAAKGYRVLAVDLPGHGESDADGSATLASVTRQLLRACPRAELAIGHSMGGLLLSHWTDALGLERAVFVDTPLSYRQTSTSGKAHKQLERIKSLRTVDWLAENRPSLSRADREVEARAARQFDAETSGSLMASLADHGAGVGQGVRAMAVVPEASSHLSADDLGALRSSGVEVRFIEGAGHTVWYGNVETFMAAIEDWL